MVSVHNANATTTASRPAQAGPVKQADVIRQAFTALGWEAGPERVRRHILDTYGMTIALTAIATVKKQHKRPGTHAARPAAMRTPAAPLGGMPDVRQSIVIAATAEFIATLGGLSAARQALARYEHLAKS